MQPSLPPAPRASASQRTRVTSESMCRFALSSSRESDRAALAPIYRIEAEPLGTSSQSVEATSPAIRQRLTEQPGRRRVMFLMPWLLKCSFARRHSVNPVLPQLAAVGGSPQFNLMRVEPFPSSSVLYLEKIRLDLMSKLSL